MKTIYFNASAGKNRGFKILLVLIPLFLLGALLGIFYDSGGSKSDLSFKSLLVAQFYCGDISDIPEVVAALPKFSDSEIESSLSHWDVSYYEDAATNQQIPVFVNTVKGEVGDTTSTADLVKVPQEALALTALESDSPQVLIYSTHTSEGYSGGGTVVDVAKALKNNLESKYGIGVVVSDTVHDSPEWYQSYANSRQTASEMLANYPDAKLIIDLHRDSGVAKKSSTLEIDGVSTASLLMVVGSNLTMKHPNWEENLVTANAVGDCIKAVNGDILRGVRVQKGRYNQHLTKNAILLEVGTNLNSLDEAAASTSIAAEAINNYLASQSF